MEKYRMNEIRIIEFETEKKYIRDFINFSKKLYSKKYYVDSPSEIREILTGQHIFSKYFRAYPILAYKNEDVVARCLLTRYEKDDALYIGFFECIDDSEIAKSLFDYCEKKAKEWGYKKIIGPVDASFWIRYRMKLDHYEEQPYVGEPYNMGYYKRLFEENGLELKEKYTSTMYDKIPDNYHDRLLDGLHKRCKEKGYEIKSIKKSDYDRCIAEIYDLMTELYKGFPIFSTIDRGDFITYFDRYRHILDYRFVKMAYFNGKAIGFFIGIPDYHNHLYSINLGNLIKAVRDRGLKKRYALTYLGCLNDYKGLGFGITKDMIDELHETGSYSIGAFSHNGRVGKAFAKDLIMDTYTYGLFEKIINLE